MKIVNLEQSGPQWHKWRSAGIGGSDAPVILNESPFLSADELMEVKTGKKVIKETYRMARGKRMEPTAREKYMEITGIRCRPCCVVHDVHPWLRVSLDGLSEDNKIVLEIKCPNDHAHDTALAQKLPKYYIAQVQYQLLVTGCQTLHYVSFTDSARFPEHEQFALVKVLPDPEMQERIFRLSKEFWEQLQNEQCEGT